MQTEPSPAQLFRLEDRILEDDIFLEDSVVARLVYPWLAAYRNGDPASLKLLCNFCFRPFGHFEICTLSL